MEQTLRIRMRMPEVRSRACWLAAVAMFLSAPACSRPTGPEDASPAGPDTSTVALTDLGRGTYKGFAGGLYPDGSNQMPAEHAAAGLERARRIRPLDAGGQPNPSGKIVLLSIGMSNTSQEFCGRNVTSGCWSGSFLDQAAADESVNDSTLVIVNGAQGGRDAKSWRSATNNVYDVVRDERLRALGVTEKQVQVVWLKQANAGPRASLPDTSADAYRLESSLGEIVRVLRARYPNLQQVFLSSRTYAGYATTQLNPEPYAYESGFAVKWLVQAQIEQMKSSGRTVDALAGDLNYNSAAPWIAWGPYLWADGLNARSDGLTWVRADFVSDGTHPSPESGVRKVGTMLLGFFKSSPQTRCWFLAGQICG
jgi:hypothetical protein